MSSPSPSMGTPTNEIAPIMHTNIQLGGLLKGSHLGALYEGGVALVLVGKSQDVSFDVDLGHALQWSAELST